MAEAEIDDVFIDDITFQAEDGYALGATLFLPRGAKRHAVLTLNTPSPSRGANAPGLNQNRPPQREGVGNAGRETHPQPCVQMKKARKQSHHEHAGYPAFPHANGFTAYGALSPVIGLCCHRRRRDAPASSAA